MFRSFFSRRFFFFFFTCRIQKDTFGTNKSFEIACMHAQTLYKNCLAVFLHVFFFFRYFSSNFIRMFKLYQNVFSFQVCSDLMDLAIFINLTFASNIQVNSQTLSPSTFASNDYFYGMLYTVCDEMKTVAEPFLFLSFFLFVYKRLNSSYKPMLVDCIC